MLTLPGTNRYKDICDTWTWHFNTWIHTLIQSTFMDLILIVILTVVVTVLPLLFKMYVQDLTFQIHINTRVMTLDCQPHSDRPKLHTWDIPPIQFGSIALHIKVKTMTQTNQKMNDQWSSESSTALNWEMKEDQKDNCEKSRPTITYWTSW